MFQLLVGHTSQINHKHLHHVAQSLDGLNAVKLGILLLICPDKKTCNPSRNFKMQGDVSLDSKID